MSSESETSRHKNFQKIGIFPILFPAIDPSLEVLPPPHQVYDIINELSARSNGINENGINERSKRLRRRKNPNPRRFIPSKTDSCTANIMEKDDEGLENQTLNYDLEEKQEPKPDTKQQQVITEVVQSNAAMEQENAATAERSSSCVFLFFLFPLFLLLVHYFISKLGLQGFLW